MIKAIFKSDKTREIYVYSKLFQYNSMVYFVKSKIYDKLPDIEKRSFHRCIYDLESSFDVKYEKLKRILEKCDKDFIYRQARCFNVRLNNDLIIGFLAEQILSLSFSYVMTSFIENKNSIEYKPKKMQKSIPIIDDIMCEIFSFLKTGRNNLNNIATVNKAFYYLFLRAIKRIIITPWNAFKIPVLTLNNVEEVIISDSINPVRSKEVCELVRDHSYDFTKFTLEICAHLKKNLINFRKIILVYSLSMHNVMLFFKHFTLNTENTSCREIFFLQNDNHGSLYENDGNIRCCNKCKLYKKVAKRAVSQLNNVVETNSFPIEFNKHTFYNLKRIYFLISYKMFATSFSMLSKYINLCSLLPFAKNIVLSFSLLNKDSCQKNMSCTIDLTKSTSLNLVTMQNFIMSICEHEVKKSSFPIALKGDHKFLYISEFYFNFFDSDYINDCFPNFNSVFNCLNNLNKLYIKLYWEVTPSLSNSEQHIKDNLKSELLEKYMYFLQNINFLNTDTVKKINVTLHYDIDTCTDNDNLSNSQFKEFYLSLFAKLMEGIGVFLNKNASHIDKCHILLDATDGQNNLHNGVDKFIHNKLAMKYITQQLKEMKFLTLFNIKKRIPGPQDVISFCTSPKVAYEFNDEPILFQCGTKEKLKRYDGFTLVNSSSVKAESFRKKKTLKNKTIMATC